MQRTNGPKGLLSTALLVSRLALAAVVGLAVAACDGSGSAADPTAQADTGGSNTTSVALAATSYSVQQATGSVSLSVARTGDPDTASTVAYASANGTAMAGSDYTAVSGTLTWAAGESAAKSISVAIKSASAFSGTKTFTVSLSDPSVGTSIATPAATVMISGSAPATNPPPPSAAGTLNLSATTYAAIQSAGELNFTVTRTGGSTSAASVSYATSDGTAVAGTNYTAADGQIDWADGDANSKTISIEINSAATFSGTKTFKITLSGADGATLGTTSGSVATITGSGPGGVIPPTGTGAPSAVSKLQVVNQGGTSNDSSPATNIQQISWSAATPGANAISYYRIYRNGTAYATTTALTYVDKNATNSNDPTWAKATTVYSYDVTAVDTQGTEGPKASQMSVYAYQNGKSNWSNYDLTYGNVVENYSSTAGIPQGGQFDIQASFPSGGFQPTAHAPQAPIDDLEVGAFKYLVIDVNPGNNVNYALQVGTVSRLPPGDVYGWGPTQNAFDYGPKPVANKWATYKIPLAALNMGVCPFTGSISGNKLRVTAVASGCFVDNAGFVTGPGIPGGTYVLANDQTGSIGTFTVAGPGINGSTNVPSASLTFQRTSLYKMTIFPNSNQTLYFNNIGFTTN
jgi:hypothetical protein